MFWINPVFFLTASTSLFSFGESTQKRSVNNEIKIVCYYSNWAIYRPGLAKFTPENINPYLCTHIIYAFVGMNKDYELKPFDSYNDIQQGNYKKFVGLKKYNPDLKVLLAIGGWNEGSKRFSKLVDDHSARQRFTRSAVRFLRQHGFDGLDMDWEYPGFRDGSSDDDRIGYAQLIKELREEFDSEPVPSGKSRLILSIAVPAGKQYIDKGFDVASISTNVDFMSLLSYDYHTAHEPQTNHHAPLYKQTDLSDWDERNNLNVEWTVDYYLKLGCPREKLLVGIPTYGRSYTLQDSNDHGLEAATDGPGEKGPATREKGYLAYYEICQKVIDDEWTVEAPFPSRQGPHAYKDNQWVSFDDEEIIIEKARYILKHRLGGAMIWTLDNDDFRGSCYEEQSPLITTLRSALLSNDIDTNSGDNIYRPVVPEVIYKPTTTTTTTTSTTRPPTTQRLKHIDDYEKFDDKNDHDLQSSKIRETSSRQLGDSSKYSARRQSNRLRTPAPPTTPDPGPAFECDDEGFYINPKDCKKYFWCLDSGPSNLGIVPHAFTCPSGLYFNPNKDSCDYPENVACKVKPTESSKAVSTTTRSRSRPTKRRTTTTTTTTTSTTIAPITYRSTVRKLPQQHVVGDLSKIKDPVHHALNSSNQSILDLLRLVESLGGVDRIQEMIAAKKKAEAKAAVTTETPVSTTPQYITARRRRVTIPPLTTTPAPSRGIQYQVDRFPSAYTQPPYRPATIRVGQRTDDGPVGTEYQRAQTLPPSLSYSAPVTVKPQIDSNEQDYPFVYQSPNRNAPQTSRTFTAVEVPVYRIDTTTLDRQADTTPRHSENDNEGFVVYQRPLSSRPGRVVQIRTQDGRPEGTLIHIINDNGKTGILNGYEIRDEPDIHDGRSTPTDISIVNPNGIRRVVAVRRRTQAPNSYELAQSVGVRRVIHPSVSSQDNSDQPISQGSLYETSRFDQSDEDRSVTRSPSRQIRPGYRRSNTQVYISESEDDYSNEPAVFEGPTRSVSQPNIRQTLTTSRPYRVQTASPPRQPPKQRGTTPRTVVVDDNSPPLLINGNGKIECYRRGVYIHPDDCTSFIACAPSKSSESGFRGILHHCPQNQLFEEEIGRCMPAKGRTCATK